MIRMKTLAAATAALGLALAIAVPAHAVEWKMGHILPPDHPANRALEAAAAEIAEKTDGRIEITVFPAGQIGAAKEILTGMQLGTTEMAFDGAGILSQWLPALSVLEAPYLAKDFAHLTRMIDSEAGQQLLDELRQSAGMRVLDIWYYGTRQITNNVRPIETVADLKDIKLRVPEVDLSLKFARALGMTPTPMAFPELYLGLQTGVVDGQENPLPTINAAKFYEVQKNLALSNHLVQFVAPIVSETAWSAASEEDRQVVVDVLTNYGAEYSQKVIDSEAALVDELASKGMEVSRPEREPFAAAMTPVYEEFKGIWGADVYESLAAVE